jgi:hypothetical protein
MAHSPATYMHVKRLSEVRLKSMIHTGLRRSRTRHVLPSPCHLPSPQTDLDSFEDIVGACEAFQPDDASEFNVSLYF